MDQSNIEADLDTSLFQLPIRRRQPAVTEADIIENNSAQPDRGITNTQEPWHVTRSVEAAIRKRTGSDLSQAEVQQRLTEMAFEALAIGDSELLALYLDAGALIEEENVDGLTLLVMAIKDSHVAMTRLLLQRKADPQHRVDGKPPLFHAVQNRDNGPVLIRLLLDHGANINTICGLQRMNALHWAAAAGMVDSAAYLLSKGIDIEATCAGQHTALHVAAGTGKSTIARLLLAHGAELAKQGELSGNAMAFAASMGHVEIVKLCIQEGLPVDECDEGGLTALMSACELGHTAVVEYFLEKGADVNRLDARQSTPALKAAARGHCEILRALIDKGADLSRSDTNGLNPLEIAMTKGHSDIVNLILARSGGRDYPLESVSREIASARRIETIRSLIKSASLMHMHVTPTTNLSRNHGWVKWVLDTGGDLVRRQAMSNMIIIAIADADLDLVKELLAVGADPNEFSLSTAVANQILEIVQLLLDRGCSATPSARCIKGPGGCHSNILLDALLNIPQGTTCLAILQLLLDSGRFNILAGESSNSTAFWRVLESDDWGPEIQDQVAFMMLNSVKDINFACNSDGGTLMHHVVRHGRQDMAIYLLERGADINAQDLEGRTPFLLACEYQAPLLSFLLQRRADPNLQYEDGRGPLHAAATVGNVEALHLLLSENIIARELDRSSRDGGTPLACALAADQEEAALFLIEHGATLEHTVTVNGRTMLHLAAAFGHERVFDQIMDLAVVDVNTRDTVNGSTPLLLACAGTRYKSGSSRIVNALLAAGADMEIAGSHHDRPLHVAVATRNTEIAQILIQHGADVAVAGDKGRTPLHKTAEYGNLEIMRLILQSGVNPGVTDDSGWTPLHLCTEPLGESVC